MLLFLISLSFKYHNKPSFWSVQDHFFIIIQNYSKLGCMLLNLSLHHYADMIICAVHHADHYKILLVIYSCAQSYFTFWTFHIPCPQPLTLSADVKTHIWIEFLLWEEWSYWLIPKKSANFFKLSIPTGGGQH